MTEGRNTGFKKIIDVLEANGSPKPEFETDEDRSYFITRLFVHEGFVKKESEEPTKGLENEIVHETSYYGAHETAHDTIHEGRHEGRHDTRHESRHDTSYDEQVRQLIDFCDVPRSRSEMQEYLGITSRGYFAYKYIKPLVEEGKLEMTIPDKPQSRKQKYVRANS